MFMTLAYLCWGLFVAVWALGAIYNVFRRGGGSDVTFLPRWSLLALVLIAADRAVPGGVFAYFRVSNIYVAYAGAIILMGSTAFTLWARWALGIMWSPVPTVQRDHELRTAGPYRVTRHPIYTGILGMLLGTTMLSGSPILLLLLVAFGVTFWRRMQREEQLMQQTFGPRYTEYRASVPRFLPFWPKPRLRH
jgi:protein-S-isoprenylcysteine O-methyltransferase Ste14